MTDESKRKCNIIIILIEILSLLIFIFNLETINCYFHLKKNSISLLSLYIFLFGLLEFIREKIVGVLKEKITVDLTETDLIKAFSCFFDKNCYKKIEYSDDNISIYEKDETRLVKQKIIIIDNYLTRNNEQMQETIRDISSNLKKEMQLNSNRKFYVYLILLTNNSDDNIMNILSNNIYINPIISSSGRISDDIGNFIIPVVFDCKEKILCFGEFHKFLPFYKNKKNELIDIINEGIQYNQ